MLALYGEGAARVVVSCLPENVEAVEAAARDAGVPVTRLGTVGGDALVLAAGPARCDVPIAELRAAYEGGLNVALQSE
jgi:phosphoribosylformylglycinamidine synthase